MCSLMFSNFAMDYLLLPYQFLYEDNGAHFVRFLEPEKFSTLKRSECPARSSRGHPYSARLIRAVTRLFPSAEQAAFAVISTAIIYRRVGLDVEARRRIGCRRHLTIYAPLRWRRNISGSRLNVRSA